MMSPHTVKTCLSYPPYMTPWNTEPLTIPASDISPANALESSESQVRDNWRRLAMITDQRSKKLTEQIRLKVNIRVRPHSSFPPYQSIVPIILRLICRTRRPRRHSRIQNWAAHHLVVIKTPMIHELIHAREVMTLNCTKLLLDPNKIFSRILDFYRLSQSNFTQYNTKYYPKVGYSW